MRSPLTSGLVPDLSRRDRLVQAELLALSPAERLARMQKLISRSWAMLQRNPAAVEHFLRRSYRARAIRPPVTDGHDGA